MRVLVLEQEHAGHHYHYPAYILPPLADLVDEVVVAITPLGRESAEFRSLLAPLADRVDFQPVLPPGDAALSMKGRIRLFEGLRDAVARFRPDYVLLPSGDGQTTGMGLSRLAGRGGLPGGVPGEAGIHYGYGAPGIGAKNRLKDLIYSETQRLAGWEKVHYVSVVNYEWIRTRGGSLARRASLLPHPVPPSARLDRGECRRQLGLPEDGRYLGLVAEIDPRKAIVELLAAFRAAAGPDDRLVLGGRLHAPFARLIEAEYADLVEGRRLILFNHYIDRPTSDLILGALDVVCTPYPRFGHLSSALLHGIAAGKPVLGNAYGWTRAMVRRFGFGWTCDIHDPGDFARAIREALEQGPGYRESEATRRLLAFHAPANFAAKWLGGIRARMGLPPSADLVEWPWVLDALDEGRRSLK